MKLWTHLLPKTVNLRGKRFTVVSMHHNIFSCFKYFFCLYFDWFIQDLTGILLHFHQSTNQIFCEKHLSYSQAWQMAIIFKPWVVPIQNCAWQIKIHCMLPYTIKSLHRHVIQAHVCFYTVLIIAYRLSKNIKRLFMFFFIYSETCLYRTENKVLMYEFLLI